VAEGTTELADRVFVQVLAPLVLGGPLRPSHPIGARAALALCALSPRASDGDLASRVDLARVAEARRIVPIDTLPDPAGAEWAMGAVLHDVLQAANPAWVRRSAPKRLLELAAATLARIAPAASALDALARHTWFGRLFDLRRKDTAVSWWTGSGTFLGKEPPRRLLMWSDVRRVNVARSERGIMELLSHGGQPEHAPLFASVVSAFLRATPLTDLSSCARSAPAFEWTPEALGVTRAPVARTLALRALSLAPQEGADAALGRATRALFASKAWKPVAQALDFLGHRAMSIVQGADVLAPVELSDDAVFARTAGAMVARRWVVDPATPISDADRRRLAPVFDVALRGAIAREIEAMIQPPSSGASGAP
jgi:hypothetical protein